MSKFVNEIKEICKKNKKVDMYRYGWHNSRISLV